MRKTVALGVMGLLLVWGGAGCSSTRAPQAPVHTWEDWIEPKDPAGVCPDAAATEESWRDPDSAPDAKSEAWQSRVRRWLGSIGAGIGRGADSMQGFVYTKVARVKRPRAQLLDFSSENVTELEHLLRPGDLILTFTEGYVGNLFLPGVFKHGIIYVGLPEEREAAGLTEQFLWKQVCVRRWFEQLKTAVATAETEQGHPADVVEAVAEGVKFSSLEHLLATHINRMVVLRPRISRQEMLETLAAVFAHVGLPYDFDFDFTDPSKLTCTELISRVLSGKGEIHFEMTRVRGRWAVTADDIARHALSEPTGTFEVVALADRAPDQVDWDATLFTGPEARSALHRLIEGSGPK